MKKGNKSGMIVDPLFRCGNDKLDVSASQLNMTGYVNTHRRWCSSNNFTMSVPFSQHIYMCTLV